MFIHRRRGWEIPERDATPEAVVLGRRGLIGAASSALLGGTMLAGAATPAAAQWNIFGRRPNLPDISARKPLPAPRNAKYEAGRAITGELEATLIRPDRKDEKPRFGKLGGIRQWVESVFDTMKGQLTLEDHGGRTIPGVYSRVAGRLLALAAGIWHNWLIGEPNKRSLIAYDH